MALAFNLLLTLLIELPIIALFFAKKKRPSALMYGLLVNMVSWPVIHILKISTEVNFYWIELLVVIGEGIGIWLLTKCGWQRGLAMSVIANTLSFVIIKFLGLDTDMLQASQEVFAF